MLDRVQAGTCREHPAAEDLLDLALQRNFLDLDEGVGVRRFRRGPRVARLRLHSQRAELHRLADVDIELDDAAGDLVDPENTACLLTIFCAGGSVTISSPGCSVAGIGGALPAFGCR